MDLDADDEILKSLANGQSMDYGQWPGLLTRLIPRLEKIVHDDFPVPTIPQPPTSQTVPPSSPPQIQSQEPSIVAETSSQISTGSSQSTNKENDPPPPAETGTLPPQILELLSSITSTLETWFSKYPPHTIQRLAELILSPRQHYRTLPSYLHAVDRVVHVTSGANVFPLPPAIPDPSSAAVLSNGTSSVDPLSISWGKSTQTQQPSLGSDESLGGALLTPITWLNKNGTGSRTHSPIGREVRTESTETIEGPNGPGGIETVSVSINGISSTREIPSSSVNDTTTSLRAEGGVTQGELLRQEQRAGVVPAAQLTGHRADADGLGEEDEAPHARGPEEIGMEDMGPQTPSSLSERNGPGSRMTGIDVEAAVGRKLEPKEDDVKVEAQPQRPSTPKRVAEENIGADEKRLKEGEGKDTEMESMDADENAEEDMKSSESGENKGS